MRVARLAFEFRQEFKKDVVIDMVCYRRRGHNEGDDPSMTQPLMYNLIEAKRSVRKLYTEALIGRGDITVEEAEQALRDYQGQLERVFAETREATAQSQDAAAPARASSRRPSRRRRSAPAPSRPPSTPRSSRRSPTRTSPCPTASPCTRSCCRCCSGGPRWRPRAASTGRWASCSRSARCCSRARRSGWPARTAAAARSASGTPSSPTRRPATSGRRCAHLDEGQARFWIYDSLLSRVRGDGLRVRLLGRPAGRAGAVGGAVRRLRQRRADDHRRVHLLVRAEVGPALVGRAAAAARLRGPGPGPLLRRGSSASCSCAPRTT